MIPRRALQRAAVPAKRLASGEALVRRNPLWYPRAARLFARLEAAGLEERRAWTCQRLAKVLAFAAATPYGRRVRGGADPGTWPLLESAPVRDAPRDFTRERALALPASTGGTTGVPLALWRSLQSVAVEQAAIDHGLRRHGIDPARARVAILRGEDVKDPADLAPPYWIAAQSGRRLVFSSNHLSATTIGHYVEALTGFAADYWWAYPTTLESLVRLGRDVGLRASVPLIVCSSEVLSPAVREAARDWTGAAVADYYGQAERVAFAWSDRSGEYRFLPGYAHVELRPADADAGGARYEVVGTPLWNRSMPLVRYRTGDLIETPAPLDEAEREAIALGTVSFPGVSGRDGDILVAPDGARLTGIDHLHRGVERILRIQVVHETPREVILRVIPAPGFGEAEREALLANARRKLPPAMTVTVETTDALERTPLGKTPFVLRRAGVPGPREAR